MFANDPPWDAWDAYAVSIGRASGAVSPPPRPAPQPSPRPPAASAAGPVAMPTPSPGPPAASAADPVAAPTPVSTTNSHGTCTRDHGPVPDRDTFKTRKTSSIARSVSVCVPRSEAELSQWLAATPLERMLGLDVERDSTTATGRAGAVAVVQLGDSRHCVVVQRAAMVPRGSASLLGTWTLPGALVRVLRSTRYIKAGVAVMEDVRALERSCCAPGGKALVVNAVLDLQPLHLAIVAGSKRLDATATKAATAVERADEPGDDSEGESNVDESTSHADRAADVGLDRLAQRVLGIGPLDKQLARAPWSRAPLTPSEVEYAAVDAVLSCLCAHALLGTTPSPGPPRSRAPNRAPPTPASRPARYDPPPPPPAQPPPANQPAVPTRTSHPPSPPARSRPAADGLANRARSHPAAPAQALAAPAQALAASPFIVALGRASAVGVTSGADTKHSTLRAGCSTPAETSDPELRNPDAAGSTRAQSQAARGCAESKRTVGPKGADCDLETDIARLALEAVGHLGSATAHDIARAIRRHPEWRRPLKMISLHRVMYTLLASGYVSLVQVDGVQKRWRLSPTAVVARSASPTSLESGSMRAQ